MTVALSASVYGRSSQDRALTEANGKVAQAARVERAPVLDGTLRDPLWHSAAPIRDFRQREPYEGQMPTEKTEVRILYTRHAVYFGIFCQDSDPTGIVATELRRDLPQNLDDYFEILIDSTHDRRNAYVFQVNPLGTQSDGLITEERRSEDPQDFDPGWDGVWTSAAKITGTGWTATVGIPFGTLNFTQSNDVVWGLNFKRFIRRKNEEDLWSGYRRVFGITKVSEAGQLTGITDIGSGRLFIIKPYALGGYNQPKGSPVQAVATGGLDMKYGLRSNLVVNLTANTDFSTVEVDQQQFNLTPYKLFIPEKRPFFLENAGVFDFSTGSQDLLYYSRQIGIDFVTGQEVPINAGAKVTGALGKYQLGVMEVNTRSDGPNPYGNYGVVRVKRSLFEGSYLGVMGIDKESGNAQDPYNRTGGVDTRLVFFKNLVLNGYAARTWSPLASSGDSNVGGQVTYETNWLQVLARSSKIGPNYNPEVGFVELVGVNPSGVDLNLRPRPKIRGVRELNFESFIYHAPDNQRVLQNQEWQATFRAEFNNGAYTDDDIVDVFTQRLTQPFNIYGNVVIPPGLYHFTRHQLTYGSRQDRRFTFNLFERFGTYFDGHLNELRVRTNYRPNPRFSLSTTAQWNRFNLQQGNSSVVVGGLQANYSFSRFLTTSTIVQINTANNQAVSANIRLRYNYRPDSDLYVVYNVGPTFLSLNPGNPQPLFGQRLAVKFTYSFSPSRERRGKSSTYQKEEEP